MLALIASLQPAAPAAAAFPGANGRLLVDIYRNGNQDIYVMEPDGSGLTQLTTDTAMDTHGALSPDGSRIAFTSNRDGNGEIYVMNADGSNQTRLTWTRLGMMPQLGRQTARIAALAAHLHLGGKVRHRGIVELPAKLVVFALTNDPNRQ